MPHAAPSPEQVMHRETAAPRARLPLSLCAVVVLVGCHAPLVAPDPAPPPATVTDEAHTGPFAAGKSLSFDAVLKPLDPNPVKEIRIDASNKVIDLAPGVKYSAWTLGDQVPWPTVRACGPATRFASA